MTPGDGPGAEPSQEVELTHEGEPVIKGTGIEVHRIAALIARGMTPDEVLDDYPSLTRHAVDVAKAYADAHPKAARPYPRMPPSGRCARPRSTPWTRCSTETIVPNEVPAQVVQAQRGAERRPTAAEDSDYWTPDSHPDRHPG
jgi:uncharacterized protein (DUF433 family)